MSKTEKELAFLQDLYIANDWTERFTELLGENFKTEELENILYINAGTGTHALALEEKLDEDTEMTAVAQNEELLKIAQAKADAVRSNIRFTDRMPGGEKFDAVIADASFVKPSQLKEFMKEAADASRWKIAYFLPTAGSFGEIFSYLWQTLLELDWLEKGAEIENLLNELPTISEIETAARDLGFKKIETKTKNEVFEYENGAEFVASPLVTDFLFENWLGFLSEAEKEMFSGRLAQTIDNERQGLTFRFDVKATLVTGAKG
mgnify:CR=1 FL=1|jgi:hypothetical protein